PAGSDPNDALFQASMNLISRIIVVYLSASACDHVDPLSTIEIPANLPLRDLLHPVTPDSPTSY
ncbi:MAG TPA: hypothetical protein DHW45_21480, partial [Candidatus Latescibacteria bacterium]|nr:hypothetical protein [Candidatus Latescibacterota bacterium]